MRHVLARESLRRTAGALVGATLLLAALAGAARESPQPAIAISALPAEARTTLERIRAGGSFPYPRDGVVFSNRENLLPAKARGYYHEYTVPTPGVRTRGARRIPIYSLYSETREPTSEKQSAPSSKRGKKSKA